MGHSSIPTSADLQSASAIAGPVLEEKTQAFVDRCRHATPVWQLSPEDGRQLLTKIQTPALPGPPTTIEDLIWPIGPTGTVRIRIVRPKGVAGVLPVILYCHGGGWVLGDRNSHDHVVRQLSAQSNAAVVFVDYDNAPTVGYPTNNEQAYAALEHVAASGASLQLDPSRIAVVGDAAGGNMAAALTLMAKQRQGPKITHQVLFYPTTDNLSDNESYQLFGQGPCLTKETMAYFIAANFPPESRDDVLAFPLKATIDQLSGLPSATIIVGECDLVRDEAEAYAQKLMQAGVTVTSTRYNGTIHDFVVLNPLADTPAAKAALCQASAALRGAFVA